MENPDVAWVPLSEIFADFNWNSRSAARIHASEAGAVHEGEVDQGEGLEGLKRTILERGQDTPVIIRKVEDGISLGGQFTRKPYELVAGFRRYTAMQELGKANILAHLRKISPIEALLLNGRENTDRQNLTTPDLVRVVARLLAAGLSQSQIAKELSITHSYVNRLAKIAKLPEDVVRHWRGDIRLPGVQGVPRALATQDLIELQMMAERESLLPHQVIERYIVMLAPSLGRPKADNSVHITRRVHQMATLAGELVRAGVLREGSLEWSRIIGPRSDGFVVDTGPMKLPDRERYYNMAREAFNAARDRQ